MSEQRRHIGAHGFFEVCEDVSRYTKADLFQPRNRTPVFVRFSGVRGDPAPADTARGRRGFAVRFFTEEGNYDLPGGSLPVFCRRAANGPTDLPCDGLQALAPEAAHQATMLMSGRGVPRTLRHMNGYGGRTFSWVNRSAEWFWVKYHLKTAQGVECLDEAEAAAVAADDPQHHHRDLRAAIEAGEAPEWRLEVQVMPFAEAAGCRFDPFDPTRVWPHGERPPIEVGRLVLNRNPEDFFAEPGQAGFSVSNLVPGTGLGPVVETGRGDDFAQAGALVREVMDEAQRREVAANLIARAGDAAPGDLAEYWSRVDPRLGARVAAGLGRAAVVPARGEPGADREGAGAPEQLEMPVGA